MLSGMLCCPIVNEISIKFLKKHLLITLHNGNVNLHYLFFSLMKCIYFNINFFVVQFVLGLIGVILPLYIHPRLSWS